MSVRVTDFISTTDPADTYPTHKAEMGKGGHRTVASLVDRDAISATRREEGMTVYVIATATTYRLGANLTSWTALIDGGGMPKFSADFGDEVNSVFDITHGLASEDIFVQVWRKTTKSLDSLVGVRIVDSNQVRLDLGAEIPSLNEMTVKISRF